MTRQEEKQWHIEGFDDPSKIHLLINQLAAMVKNNAQNCKQPNIIYPSYSVLWNIILHVV